MDCGFPLPVQVVRPLDPGPRAQDELDVGHPVRSSDRRVLRELLCEAGVAVFGHILGQKRLGL